MALKHMKGCSLTQNKFLQKIFFHSLLCFSNTGLLATGDTVVNQINKDLCSHGAYI